MNVASHQRRTDAVVYSRAAVSADSASADSRSVDVVASTEAIDSHGTILRQNWDLSRFRENPVVLYAHDRHELPIGTASNVRVEAGQLRATLTFSSEALNPQAEQVWLNVKAGVLRGISVGFWPHTVRFEKQDDKEVLVLDDLELLEISVVPVGSNPETLSEMRERAIAERAAPPVITTPIQPSPSPAASAETNSRAAGKDPKTMSEKSENSQFVQAITIALGLPVGSTESDILSRASASRDFEKSCVALASATTAPEALGALRGLVGKAAEVEALSAELVKVRGERDKQNFETLIVGGKSERKLDAALAKFYEDEFNAAPSEARSAVVDRLKGHLSVLKPAFPAQARQVAAVSTQTDLTWNGKMYADLAPQKREELNKTNPDLHAAMRSDWVAAGKPVGSWIS